MFRRAMTFSETLVVAAVVGMVLTLVALGITAVRTDLRTRQTWDLLGTLATALDAYHEATGAWPVDDRPDHMKLQSMGTDSVYGSAEHVIDALHKVDTSRVVLDRIENVLRDERREQSAWTVVDGWGRRLRCLTAGSERPLERQAVAANGGKPIFVSAGGDGRFGVEEVAAAADNLMIRPAPRRDMPPGEESDMSWGEIGGANGTQPGE